MNTKINPICYLSIHEYVKEVEKAVNKLRGTEEIDFKELQRKQKERDREPYQFVKVFKDIK